MDPLALQRLWRARPGSIPHLDEQQWKSLSELCNELAPPYPLDFWGLVAESRRYRGHAVLRCFNCGAAQASYPWHVRLSNFGADLPATITRAGTARLEHEPKSLLDQLEQPYLVFTYDAPAQTTEYIEPGMLITDASGPPVGQQRRFEVVLPPDVDPPGHDGVLFYFLHRRMPFRALDFTRWVPAGAPYGCVKFTIEVQHPVILEAGWPVLMLEKDRWLWGVVAA